MPSASLEKVRGFWNVLFKEVPSQLKALDLCYPTEQSLSHDTSGKHSTAGVLKNCTVLAAISFPFSSSHSSQLLVVTVIGHCLYTPSYFLQILLSCLLISCILSSPPLFSLASSSPILFFTGMVNFALEHFAKQKSFFF